jgi:hypothetical protein
MVSCIYSLFFLFLSFCIFFNELYHFFIGVVPLGLDIKGCAFFIFVRAVEDFPSIWKPFQIQIWNPRFQIFPEFPDLLFRRPQFPDLAAPVPQPVKGVARL